jgi:hypothetical protein
MSSARGFGLKKIGAYFNNGRSYSDPKHIALHNLSYTVSGLVDTV